MLSGHTQWELVGEATDGSEAVQMAVELKPDLILMDIGLPALNGIDAASQIGKLIPEAKTIFLTLNNDAELVEAVLSGGAQGYILKSDYRSELLPAIEAVLRGETSVSRHVRRQDPTILFMPQRPR